MSQSGGRGEQRRPRYLQSPQPGGETQPFTYPTALPRDPSNTQAPPLGEEPWKQMGGVMGQGSRAMELGGGGLGLCGWTLRAGRRALGSAGRRLELRGQSLGAEGVEPPIVLQLRPIAKPRPPVQFPHVCIWTDMCTDQQAHVCPQDVHIHMHHLHTPAFASLHPLVHAHTLTHVGPHMHTHIHRYTHA